MHFHLGAPVIGITAQQDFTCPFTKVLTTGVYRALLTIHQLSDRVGEQFGARERAIDEHAEFLRLAEEFEADLADHRERAIANQRGKFLSISEGRQKVLDDIARDKPEIFCELSREDVSHDVPF